MQHNKKIFEKDYNRICELYTFNNLSARKIGEIFNVSSVTILNVLKRKNIKIKNSSSNRKYTVNNSYFDKINTEDKAYFLGLLFSDGYVNYKNKNVELSLSGESDLYILEKFKDFLKSTYPIYKKDIKNHKTSFRIQFNSKQIVNSLMNLGCVQKKSLILKFPTEEQVPNHLIHHFIRGYFDGDGSVSHKKDDTITCSIMSSKIFIDDLILKLKEFGINLSSYQDKNANLKTSYIKSGNLITIHKLYKFIYNDANLFLNRKKVVFDNFFNSYIKNIQSKCYVSPELKIKEICSELGIEYKKELKCRLKEEEQLKIIDKYKELKRIRQTALFFNVSQSLINNILKIHNIKKYQSF